MKSPPWRNNIAVRLYKLRCRSCLFGGFSFFHSSSCTGPISSKIYFLCRFIFHSGLDERERVPRSIGNASMFLKTYFTPWTRSPLNMNFPFCQFQWHGFSFVDMEWVWHVMSSGFIPWDFFRIESWIYIGLRVFCLCSFRRRIEILYRIVTVVWRFFPPFSY